MRHLLPCKLVRVVRKHGSCFLNIIRNHKVVERLLPLGSIYRVGLSLRLSLLTKPVTEIGCLKFCCLWEPKLCKVHVINVTNWTMVRKTLFELHKHNNGDIRFCPGQSIVLTTRFLLRISILLIRRLKNRRVNRPNTQLLELAHSKRCRGK